FFYIFFFFYNVPATPELYTLSLHDALPISCAAQLFRGRQPGPYLDGRAGRRVGRGRLGGTAVPRRQSGAEVLRAARRGGAVRSDAGRRRGAVLRRRPGRGGLRDVYRAGRGRRRP